MKKGILKNFAKFTGKHLCQGLFFSKVAGLRPATLLKKRLWHRCFPVNFAKFLKTSFLQNTSRRLFLQFCLLIYFRIFTNHVAFTYVKIQISPVTIQNSKLTKVFAFTTTRIKSLPKVIKINV